jgi:hypothetical protein
MKQKNRRPWSILASCVLGLMAMPAQAGDQTDDVIQKLASHTYVIPRDLIEMIYKPDYSRAPIVNPNWPREPVIRLVVQWPGFSAAIKTKEIDLIKHRINISLASLEEQPITPIEQLQINLAKSGYDPTFEPAEYGLVELHSGLTKGHNLRWLIARPSSNVSFLVRCNVPGQNFAGDCEFDFPYSDVKVNAHFDWVLLEDWAGIYEKSVTLLDGMRKD